MACKYHISYEALHALGSILFKYGWHNELQPLLDENIRDLSEGEDKKLDGKQTVSWIWRIKEIQILENDSHLNDHEFLCVPAMTPSYRTIIQVYRASGANPEHVLISSWKRYHCFWRRWYMLHNSWHWKQASGRQKLMWMARESCQTCVPKVILHTRNVRQHYICLFDDTSSHFGRVSLLTSSVCRKLLKILCLRTLESSIVPQLQGQEFHNFKLEKFCPVFPTNE